MFTINGIFLCNTLEKVGSFKDKARHDIQIRLGIVWFPNNNTNNLHGFLVVKVVYYNIIEPNLVTMSHQHHMSCIDIIMDSNITTTMD